MVTFVRYPTTDWGPPFGRLLKPHKSKMEGDIQVRFYRDCIYTSYILQLEERPWSVSTAIVAVREPSRTGNRGAAAPIFWPGRRCLPELAEGDRKVGCRRPTFLKFAKRRQIIWFFPTWQACIFRRSRTDECPTPRHENATQRTDNRVILKIGRAVFWMAANRNLRRAVMRSGVSQKVIIRITCRGLRRRRSSGSPRSTCRPPWAGRCACRAQHAFRASSPYRHRSSWPTAIRSPCRIGNLR